MPFAQNGSAEPGSDFRFGSVTLHDCTPAQAGRLVEAAVESGRPLAVHLCNAYTLTLAAKDPRLAAALDVCSLNLVDGTPVTWYFRLLTGKRADGPVRGPSFMRQMLDRPGLNHFLYGGSEAVLAKLRQRVVEQFPEATIVGGISPPFRPAIDDADLAMLVQELRSSGAHIVWVGLGTPKQDLLLQRLMGEHACVAIGVGAAFDFLSGEKAEAPDFLHHSGLEWIHRLVSEPRRLWRRYLVGNLVFLWLLCRELASSRRKASSSAGSSVSRR